MLKNFAQKLVKTAGNMVGLKYDAATPTRSRRPFVTSTLSEDKELRPHERQAIVSQGRDLLRNFALAGFMVRKHLQYVASFSFEATMKPERGASPERKQEIDDFNELLEEKVKTWQKRKNCDLEVDKIYNELIDKFGPEIAHLVGKQGDTVEMVNANTPSNEFQDFCVMVIRLIFAALDIPYSFFDGSAANYYGQKGELDNYVDSCKQKQTDLIELLDELTDWLIREWVAEGELELPAGMTIDDVKFEWTGAGLPWWRLIDDAKGYLSAFLCGLASPVEVGKSYKTNVWKNLQDLHNVLEEATRLNVSLAYSGKGDVKTNMGV